MTPCTCMTLKGICLPRLQIPSIRLRLFQATETCRERDWLAESPRADEVRSPRFITDTRVRALPSPRDAPHQRKRGPGRRGGGEEREKNKSRNKQPCPLALPLGVHPPPGMVSDASPGSGTRNIRRLPWHLSYQICCCGLSHVGRVQRVCVCPPMPPSRQKSTSPPKRAALWSGLSTLSTARPVCHGTHKSRPVLVSCNCTNRQLSPSEDRR